MHIFIYTLLFLAMIPILYGEHIYLTLRFISQAYIHPFTLVVLQNMSNDL